MEQESMSGRHSVLMDQRGRISFPSSFRASIGEWLFISPDQGVRRNYLVVRSEKGFKEELERIKTACRAQYEDVLEPDELQDEIDDACRDFASMTQRTTPDKNGRITVDKELVKYAGLESSVAVTGVGDHAEIWDESTLDAFLHERAEARMRKKAKKAAERLAKRAAEDEA